MRYPPLRGDEPEGALRAAAHGDINLLTVLPAAAQARVVGAYARTAVETAFTASA